MSEMKLNLQNCELAFFGMKSWCYERDREVFEIAVELGKSLFHIWAETHRRIALVKPSGVDEECQRYEKLSHDSSAVPVTLESALEKLHAFLNESPKPVVLVTYSEKHDFVSLIQAILKTEMDDQFYGVIAGLAESHSILQGKYEHRTPQAKLAFPILLRGLLNQEYSQLFPNATDNVKIMRELARKYISKSEFIDRSKSYKQALLDGIRAQNVVKGIEGLRPLMGIATVGTLKRMTEAGLKYSDLTGAYKDNGSEGLAALFSRKNSDGQPLVNVSSEVLEGIVNIFEKENLSKENDGRNNEEQDWGGEDEIEPSQKLRDSSKGKRILNRDENATFGQQEPRVHYGNDSFRGNQRNHARNDPILIEAKPVCFVIDASEDEQDFDDNGNFENLDLDPVYQKNDKFWNKKDSSRSQPHQLEQNRRNYARIDHRISVEKKTVRFEIDSSEDEQDFDDNENFENSDLDRVYQRNNKFLNERDSFRSRIDPFGENEDRFHSQIHRLNENRNQRNHARNDRIITEYKSGQYEDDSFEEEENTSNDGNSEFLGQEPVDEEIDPFWENEDSFGSETHSNVEENSDLYEDDPFKEKPNSNNDTNSENLNQKPVQENFSVFWKENNSDHYEDNSLEEEQNTNNDGNPEPVDEEPGYEKIDDFWKDAPNNLVNIEENSGQYEDNSLKEKQDVNSDGNSENSVQQPVFEKIDEFWTEKDFPRNQLQSNERPMNDENSEPLSQEPVFEKIEEFWKENGSKIGSSDSGQNLVSEAIDKQDETLDDNNFQSEEKLSQYFEDGPLAKRRHVG
ncbi:uncharacterized protein DDB_G0287625-like [Venturia canescens]|uniref:uncharacterized protein DDB_G0287625-like n=1 Tax=Venturia canescens TaxID=32260 RepID=UPI001C9CD261|nr:uncharacterized protein DDB_G0287625-like [Venturia canescens]